MGLLIKLKNGDTSLKSLKFGQDRPGGGDSGQPYIQTPIPESFNDLGANEDFILRGGINAVRDSATDIKRLTKMFSDLKSPNGVLFIAKQNLLSQTAVRTQTSGVVNEGIYTFVAVDTTGTPVTVPQILPETDLEKERFEAALRRKQLANA